MSPDEDAYGSVPSSDEFNEQIRDLWLRADGRLTAEQRAEYEQLVVRWANALQAELVKAA